MVKPKSPSRSAHHAPWGTFEYPEGQISAFGCYFSLTFEVLCYMATIKDWGSTQHGFRLPLPRTTLFAFERVLYPFWAIVSAPPSHMTHTKHYDQKLCRVCGYSYVNSVIILKTEPRLVLIWGRGSRVCMTFLVIRATKRTFQTTKNFLK